jgi:hypothetical protein
MNLPGYQPEPEPEPELVLSFFLSSGVMFGITRMRFTAHCTTGEKLSEVG